MSYNIFDGLRAQQEDADAWRIPPFSGDFYCEPDNACRGVTFPASDEPGPEFKDFFDGDFYREPDDVCKGLSLEGDRLVSPSLFQKGDLGLSSHMGYCSSLDTQMDVSKERFQKEDIVPRAPIDSFFKFEVTTLYATSHTPSDIGNYLMDFLNCQVVSTITKVRRHKYSIKADVFVDSMMCTMKIRVYGQELEKFAIEFQRRLGDAISFNGTFQRACEYLKPRLHMPANNVPPPLFINFAPLPFPGGLELASYGEAEQLLPILDMAASETPWLQAEAAATLSKMAAEGKPALFSPSVFQGVGELLQSNSTSVAHPTACLINSLSQQAEAAPLFASQGLLPKILEKVSCQATHPKVRQHLAHALYAATQRQSHATLSKDSADALITTFSGVLGVKDMSWGGEVIQNLEMAQAVINRQFGASY